MNLMQIKPRLSNDSFELSVKGIYYSLTRFCVKQSIKIQQ